MIFTFLFFLNSVFANNCNYQKKDCPPDHDCVHYAKEKDICVKRFVGEKLKVTYPFDKKTRSVCDQGNLSTDGNSHTWKNTAFALDLQADRTQKTNSIYAGVEGTIIAFDECKTINDQCGLGFGNQIKILTENNFLVFYAHLKEIKVKTGDKVKLGALIGVEGDTGWTGKGNRHLHLSVHYDWKAAGFEYWKNVGYLPSSVPFILSDCKEKEFLSEEIPCARNNGAAGKIFCL